MLADTPGIHHITGIVRDAQSNVDFYTEVLGLRLVKQTLAAPNDSDTPGEELFLPPWLEEDRSMIEDQLIPLELPTDLESC